MHYLLIIHILAGTLALMAAVSAVVSSKGKKIIQKLISGESVDAEQSGLSKREWNELMTALELNDRLI